MELLLSGFFKPLVIGFFIGTAIGLTGIGGGVLVFHDRRSHVEALLAQLGIG